MLSKPGEARITPRANTNTRKKVTADESPDEVVRRLQRLPSNKACADCSSKLTQCVNLTHGTFVCMPCSGVHREFNHKIKGIGHSSFTPDEVSMLKLPTSGNESVNARYLAKYDANATSPSSSSTTSGRYHDQSNRHTNNNYNNTRNVMASSTMKPPQNNSDLQHLRSWIQQKYIVKCWLVGEGGGGDAMGAKKGLGVGADASSVGGEAGRRKIMPTKVHRPTSSLPALPKPTTTSPSTTFTSDTSHSTTHASNDDAFFDAIAKVDDWDAFGTSTASGMPSPPAFQADFGDFSRQDQQQQQSPPANQFQTATMVSLPPLSTVTSQTFNATFHQDGSAAVTQNNVMMQGVSGGGSFNADFSSMPQPRQPQMQQQTHPSMQVHHNYGFASFPPVQEQEQQPHLQQQSQEGSFLQHGVETGQQVYPQSNYGHMQGGSGMMMLQQQQQQHGEGQWGETISNAPTHSEMGNLSGPSQQLSQPHPMSQQSLDDQSNFANFSSVQLQQPQQIPVASGQPISNEAAPMPPSNPNAFKVIDSDKMSAFDAFDGLALEPTATTTSFGSASGAEDRNTRANVPMNGSTETSLNEGDLITNTGSVERSMFPTDPNVKTNNESNEPYHTMVNGIGDSHPHPYPEGKMIAQNNTPATASKNSLDNVNDDGRVVTTLCHETTLLLQKLNLQQLMQIHQLVTSMTSSSLVGNENQHVAATEAWASDLPSMSYSHVSTEIQSSNGLARMGMAERGEISIESMTAMHVPPAGAPTLSSPPVMIASSNVLPPVEKEGNPFDF